MLSPLEPIISSRSQSTGHIWRFQAWINHKVMMVSTKLTSEHLERWVLNEKGFSCDSKCSLQQKSGTISPEYVTWSLARAAVHNFRLVHTPRRCCEDWRGQLTKLTVYCLIRKGQHYSLADTEALASLWLRCCAHSPPLHSLTKLTLSYQISGPPLENAAKCIKHQDKTVHNAWGVGVTKPLGELSM